MFPSLEMYRDDGRLSERTGSLNSLCGRESQMLRPNLPDASRSHEQQGYLDRVPTRDFGNAFVPDRIARDINGMIGAIVGARVLRLAAGDVCALPASNQQPFLLGGL